MVAAGDQVQATLVVASDRAWLEDPVSTKASSTAPGADTTAGGREFIPQPGDEVPNFSLVNQDEQPIRLQQYRGQVLLLTFIYTRCPLPDFCPKMAGNFAATNQALRQDPAMCARTHLLCISFDHAFDTPAVLRSYEVAYVGGDDPEIFTH